MKIRIDTKPFTVDSYHSGEVSIGESEEIVVYDFTLALYSTGGKEIQWLNGIPDNFEQVEVEILKQWNQ